MRTLGSVFGGISSTGFYVNSTLFTYAYDGITTENISPSGTSFSVYTDHLTTFVAFTEINSTLITTTSPTTVPTTTHAVTTQAKATAQQVSEKLTTSQVTSKAVTNTTDTTPKVTTTTEATTPKLTTPAPTGCDPITVEIDGSFHHFPSTLFGLVVASNVTCDNGNFFNYNIKIVLFLRTKSYLVFIFQYRLQDLNFSYL